MSKAWKRKRTIAKNYLCFREWWKQFELFFSSKWKRLRRQLNKDEVTSELTLKHETFFVVPGMVQQSQSTIAKTRWKHSSLGGEPTSNTLPIRRQSRARSITSGTSNTVWNSANTDHVAPQPDHVATNERRCSPSARKQRADVGHDLSRPGALHDQ